MQNDEGRMMNQPNPPDLRTRTKAFALRIIKMYSTLARSSVGRVLGGQVLRSGTSVGAQYREAVRARSKAEFASKMQSALQELEETVYWLELLAECGTVRKERLSALLREAEELTAIFVASVKTARKGTKK